MKQRWVNWVTQRIKTTRSNNYVLTVFGCLLPAFLFLVRVNFFLLGFFWGLTFLLCFLGEVFLPVLGERPACMMAE